MIKVFLNGKFVALKNAKISILDRGFQYGDGIFETMRAYNGCVFMLMEHINRLFISLKILHIKPPYSKKEFCDLVNKTLCINKLKNAYIKITATRGVASSGIDIEGFLKPTISIYAKPLDAIPKSLYKNGISANFACIEKNEKSFTSKIKSQNYLDNILARAEAKTAGFDEAIFVNSRGYVCEATTSNMFMVKKGVIITPPSTAGLLPGITRKAIIRIIMHFFNNKIYEKNIKPYDLINADEIFLTNSILEIIPVVKLGKTKISCGKPGIFTRLLRVLYKIHAAKIGGGV